MNHEIVFDSEIEVPDGLEAQMERVISATSRAVELGVTRSLTRRV